MRLEDESSTLPASGVHASRLRTVRVRAPNVYSSIESAQERRRRQRNANDVSFQSIAKTRRKITTSEHFERKIRQIKKSEKKERRSSKELRLASLNGCNNARERTNERKKDFLSVSFFTECRSEANKTKHTGFIFIKHVTKD